MQPFRFNQLKLFLIVSLFSNLWGKKCLLFSYFLFLVLISNSQTTIINHDFNASADGWTSSSGWVRSTTSFVGNTTNHWHTDPFGPYNLNMSVFVTSGTIDLSNAENLTLTFQLRYDTETSYDGARLEYSANGGTNWTPLGEVGSGTNWYNDTEVDAIGVGADGWTANNSFWRTASIRLPADVENNSNVRFRFFFASDFVITDNGAAFDDFKIESAPTTYLGPGGVGAIDGNSILKVWLRADDLDGDNDFTDNPADGSSVSNWIDYSGYSTDYTGSGVNRPTYNSSGTFKSVNFDGSGTDAQTLEGDLSGSYSDGSVFFAMNPTDNGNSASLFDNSDFSLRLEQHINLDVGYTRYGISNYVTTISPPFGVNSIISYHKKDTTSNFTVHVNGSTGTLSAGINSAGIPYDRIGPNRADDRANGDFFEIILFQGDLNSAETQIVENYLSAKYGGISIPSDLYDEDDVANGNYDFDVAGIGQASDGSSHEDSQGTGIVRINTPSNLGNAEFFFWGHDDGALSSFGVTDLPTGVESRLERVWRASETGEVGTTTISFDLSNVSGAIVTSDLRLLIDTDNDGIFADETASGVIAGASNTSGKIYQWTGIDIDDNLRFTIGSVDYSATPLPIELISFEASPRSSSSVELKWETASEINNDFFTIERSKHGQNWVELEKVKGAGNSTNKLSYHLFDVSPLGGTSYYRLKQTDFDGEYSYSEIEAVFIENSEKEKISIYPNPTKNFVSIVGRISEIEELKIYNTLGKEISSKVQFIQQSDSRITLNLSKLPKGIYLIKTKTTINKLYKL